MYLSPASVTMMPTLFMPLALEFGCRLCIKETTAEDRPCGSIGSESDKRIKHWGFFAKFFQSAFCTPPAFSPSSHRPWKVMSWSTSWLMWQMSKSWKYLRKSPKAIQKPAKSLNWLKGFCSTRAINSVLLFNSGCCHWFSPHNDISK